MSELIRVAFLGIAGVLLAMQFRGEKPEYATYIGLAVSIILFWFCLRQVENVAAQFARTAVTGAVMNVYINTKSMADRDKAREINDRAAAALERGAMLADEIYGKVLNRLKGDQSI